MGLVPRSTYRLQLTPSFPLTDAAGWVDYVHRLGVDWVYCSPLLQAEHGSDHGYDVIDHSRTDTARGGRDGLATLAGAAHGADMGVLADIVPNHVGIASALESVWWRDVLTYGRRSEYAGRFDIDWEAGNGKVLLPVLGDGDNELAALAIDGHELRYYEHAFPLAPGSWTDDDSAQQVHDRQRYRLVNFRRADTELNYRRFFAVNTLAAIRQERYDVFAGSHAEVEHWISQGWVDGLRVDHPDGLAEPGRYLDELAGLTGGRYTVVEKILEPGEELPTNWACDGTTGYDALATIDRVLVDPAGQQGLDALDGELRGGTASWADIVHDAKRNVADGPLNCDVRRLARLVPDIGPVEVTLDALAELLACFPVYRTYLPAGGHFLTRGVEEAIRRRPDLTLTLTALGRHGRELDGEFATRLQQTSGAVMAKGVEDCAFYRYPRLASLTEVGGDPSEFAVSVAQFHGVQQARATRWPDGMTTLSTHDTKRGEDVRARTSVLAEMPGDWADSVVSWLALLNFPDRTLGNLLLQTAVGAWPIERHRLHGYAEKAAREAGTSTGWIDPDAQFETELHRLVDACYDHPVISGQLSAFADRIRPAGWSNSLAAKLIQLTAPGVPDVYRGTELWQNSLVDPDNRRPFDALAPGGAAEMLARLDEGWQPSVDESGAAKLLVTSRALRARRDRAELFTGYAPIEAGGNAAGHLIAFNRGGAVTLATRLPAGLESRGGWGEASVALPDGDWLDALTGARYGGARGGAGGVMPVGKLLDRYPVALLLRA